VLGDPGPAIRYLIVTMTAARITILYNEPTLPADHPDADSEHDVLETVDVIASHVQAAGLTVNRLGTTGDATALIAGLQSTRPDIVFNLFEGTAGWGRSEEYVAGLLELLGLPYTGCPTLPMAVCRNKPLAKRLFAGAGIPTAAYLVAPEAEILSSCPIPFPVIVKPGTEDASVGIDQKSVCQTLDELNARIAYLRSHYGPSVLVEQLIVGREFHVPVIERGGQAVVLPFTEILFPPPADGEPIWPIVTFDAKWKPQSRDFAATPAKNPAEVDDRLRREVEAIVVKTFRLLDCRDYARVDLRVDGSGRPYVLEMNPNPCINPLAGVAAALESAKIPYGDFLLGCVANALARGGKATGQLVARRASDSPAANVAVEPASGSVVLDGSPVDAIMTAADRATLDARLAKAPPADALVARIDGRVAGLVAARPTDDDGIWDLERIAVAADARRGGVGRALLAAMEKRIAGQQGRLLLASITSSPGFGAVRAFLAAAGYQQVGDCPDYYKDGTSKITFAKSFPALQEAAGATAPTSPVVGRAVTGGGLL
jgi:D-alanine-D-alanine ligase